MISDKTLFLLTKTYPFGHGEQYITSELTFLAKLFKKVIIYPNDYYSENMIHDKLLPINVKVLNFNQILPSFSKNKLRDYLYIIKHSYSEFFKTDDKENFFKNFKWNLLNFWTQYQISIYFSKYLKDNNYNSHNAVFYSYWFHKSAILMAILKDKKQINEFVSRAHSVDLYHQDWGIINEKIKVPPFKMLKLENVSKIICVSAHGANYLKNKYPQYAAKVMTQYLGVVNSSEQSSNMHDDVFRIMTCSGIDTNKRVHKLAEALVEIKYKVEWIHFGTGSLINQLQDVVNYLPENISVDIKGATPNADIHNYYKRNRIDLFVNLSIVEGLPVSIMEAMSYGIPILATEVYGTPEAVVDQKNGFLISVNFSISSLIDKINYCIENKSLLNEMRIYSRELFLEKYSAEKNYSQFANYLSSL
ncbi:MAG: glycosyltransferase [Bacteroidia bacterium]|nr:glycosyltransferase [Bacteroidia bacterium]